MRKIAFGAMSVLLPAFLILLWNGRWPTADSSGSSATRVQAAAPAAPSPLEALRQEFEGYSAAKLVFQRDELPGSGYFDRLPSLTPEAQLKAAHICVREIMKYPRGYLGAMHLNTVGVFAACVDKASDGFHPYLPRLGGYRYFGKWNAAGAICAAYYTDEQLPLTLHHEMFHHVQATWEGTLDAERNPQRDQGRYREAISGKSQYLPPTISSADLDGLRRAAHGSVLRGAVSDYAAKSAAEDQAETARHLMSSLADALVQVVESPQLPGSQRMLHCLARYRQSIRGGPDASWFVDVALGRSPAARPQTEAGRLLESLRGYAEAGRSGWDGVAGRDAQARAAVAAASKLSEAGLSLEETKELARLASQVTQQLLWCRLRAAEANASRFAMWGVEDSDGVNWTLRADVASFGDDAKRLAPFASRGPEAADAILRAQLKDLRLVAGYYAYIQAHWPVTPGTHRAFESMRDAFADSLPAAQGPLAATIKHIEMGDLAKRIAPDGSGLSPLASETGSPVPAKPAGERPNPFLEKVDRAISDPTVRDAIRHVDPACVRVASASGCCISADGLILTAAHVPVTIGREMRIAFPDGQTYTARCTALDSKLDLALLRIPDARGLPFAPLAKAPPVAGDWVCVIGQPGAYTPGGQPTGYDSFHVSTGRIRGFLENRLSSQPLGPVMHDAWTYWGHSGSPLFNRQGEIVAVHNSWDSRTAMRHAVSYEAITSLVTSSASKARTE